MSWNFFLQRIYTYYILVSVENEKEEEHISKLDATTVHVDWHQSDTLPTATIKKPNVRETLFAIITQHKKAISTKKKSKWNEKKKKTKIASVDKEWLNSKLRFILFFFAPSYLKYALFWSNSFVFPISLFFFLFAFLFLFHIHTWFSYTFFFLRFI